MANVFQSLATIFLLMTPGILFSVREVLSEDQVGGISKFLMSVALPAVLIRSMQLGDHRAGALLAGAKITGAVLLLFLCALGLGRLLQRGLGMERQAFGLLSFCLFFANTGGIGIPIIEMLLGREALFYAGIVEIVVDVLIFTLGIVLIQSSGTQKRLHIDLRQLLSPGLGAIFIGLALMALDLQLPAVLGKTLDILGGTNLPLAMFVIGFHLGKIKPGELLNDWRAYFAAAVKMICMPLAAYGICAGLLRLDAGASGVVTILMAMPTGSAAVIFSQEYGADHRYASKFVMLTTLASLATLIPAALLILSLR